MMGELAQETMNAWRQDPVFSPYYHEVGEVSALVSLLRTVPSLPH